MLLSRGEAPEIPITTLPTLNKKLWGLRKGEVTIVGARTSQGKSSVISQLAWDFATGGKKVLFLSIEMPIKRVIERLFCMVCRIDNYEMLKGRFKYEEKYPKEWATFKNLMEKHRIVFCDYIGKSWSEVENLINTFQSKPDVVIIDHVHHIHVDKKGLNEKQTLDDYLENFRTLTIRYNFSGILCAQVNRTSQEEREGEPQLHHLKSTGKLEEIADNVLLLWWPHHSNDKKDRNRYQINIAKCRYGATGRIDIKFEPEYYFFSDLSPEELKATTKKEKKSSQKDWQEKYEED